MLTFPRRVGIVATGSYLPKKVITNADLERMVETSDEWITTRSGIKERRIASGDEVSSTMSAEAAKRALEMAGMEPDEIDAIIVGTNSPDTLFPATACRVQALLDMKKRAAAFDLQAGCTGSVYAMAVATQGIAAGMWNNVLVIGVETLSRVINWEDRNTCVLFGDGAGAVIMKPVDDGGVITVDLRADGHFADLIELPAGLAKMPASEKTIREKKHAVFMKGNDVFKFTLKEIPPFLKEVIEGANLEIDDINWFIFHQANLRIIESVAKRLKIKDMDRVVVNLDKYGNTSAATIPIALDEIVRKGKVKKGDKILLVSFGSGMTYGAIIFEW